MVAPTSEAELRIRRKVHAEMRLRFPTARVIHEIVLESFGVRLDVAAVEPDRIILAEIKSERDTLKRLPHQVRAALRIGHEVWVVAGPKHEAAILAMGEYSARGPDGEPLMAEVRSPTGTVRGWRTVKNPDYLPQLHECRIFGEAADGSERLQPLDGGPRTRWREPFADPRALFQMLWANEMRLALVMNGFPEGVRNRPMGTLTRSAIESMTGGQIRRAVCAQLRARVFSFRDGDPSDPPIPFPLEAMVADGRASAHGRLPAAVAERLV